MRRRDFIAGLGAVAWPFAARAQQPAVPLIGYLSPCTQEAGASFVAAFRRGLSQGGYVEGRNVAIEYRWAENRPERLPTLAADLVQRQVAAIFTTGKTGPPTAKAATATIPIVFQMGEDPVKEGIVTRLDRPGGNITGFSNFANELFSKRLGLLRDIAPEAETFAFLVNPNNANADPDTKDVQAAAAAAGRRLEVLTAGSEHELQTAFADMVHKQVGGLIVGVDPPLFGTRRALIAALAIRYAIPAIYNARSFAAAGGLMSYGTDEFAPYHQGGLYVARILKGEKPGDLPVQLPTRFELVINLNTAKALGLTIPDTLLATADELIQ
jgi:putative ABC transport system substrate-binding protein